MVYLFLGSGFEEIEAVTQLDILRRAGINVISAGIGGRQIKGGHDIIVEADITIDSVNKNDADMIILPGGMGGVNSIKASEKAIEIIKYCSENGKYIAAICAAPTILGGLGIIDGVHVTCYPGCENELGEAFYEPDRAVIKEGKIITGRSPGTAIAFALELVRIIAGEETKNKVESGLCI